MESNPNPNENNQQSVTASLCAHLEKRKSIQQRLFLLLHAQMCSRQDDSSQKCRLVHCKTMKDVLSHMVDCTASKDCTVLHCLSSRQIMNHWKNCTSADCPVCVPVRNAMQNGAPGEVEAKSDANVSCANSTEKCHNSSIATPPADQIADDGLLSSFEQFISDSSSSSENQSGSSNEQPEMRVQDQRCQFQIDAENSVTNHLQMQALPMTDTKNWHSSMTLDLRNYMIHKFVQEIFPKPDPAAVLDTRMYLLVEHVKKVESAMYETANSRSEYFHLLAEKIFKVQRELDEKHRKREEQNQERNKRSDMSASQQAPSTLQRASGSIGSTDGQPIPKKRTVDLKSQRISGDEFVGQCAIAVLHQLVLTLTNLENTEKQQQFVDILTSNPDFMPAFDKYKQALQREQQQGGEISSTGADS